MNESDLTGLANFVRDWLISNHLLPLDTFASMRLIIGGEKIDLPLQETSREMDPLVLQEVVRRMPSRHRARMITVLGWDSSDYRPMLNLHQIKSLGPDKLLVRPRMGKVMLQSFLDSMVEEGLDWPEARDLLLNGKV